MLVMFGKVARQRVVEAGHGRRPERADETDRQVVGQPRHREHDEEVDAHRAPVDLAHAGDAPFGDAARDVEAQAVADVQLQRLHQALFDAQRVGLVGAPLAIDHRVVHRQLGLVAQVELALDQPLGALVGEVVLADRLAVDRHQAAADHRKPVVLRDTRFTQPLAKRLRLIGLQVDHEAVGRIGRRGSAPAGDEVGAQQHQQRQRQQADAERRHLQHREGRARGHLARGQHQPARRARLGHRRLQQAHGQPRQRGQHHHGSREAADRQAAELPIGGGRQQQRGEAGHAGTEHRQRGRLQRAEVASDHAQRRHARQLQHRRQAERHQQRHADTEPEQRGHHARRRQARAFDQVAEQRDEDQVHAPSRAPRRARWPPGRHRRTRAHTTRRSRAAARPARAAPRSRRAGAAQSRARRSPPPRRPATPPAAPPG